MRVLVTGGTGFIGKALIRSLVERGDAVTALTRRVPEGAAVGSEAATGTVRWVTWTPNEDGSWQDEIAGHDAVVHLAGETAAGRRYNDEVKREILKSRVESTTRLVAAIEKSAAAGSRPAVFVCASGVGFYGGREDSTLLDETSPAGTDFLARVCVEWETAARTAERVGLRVVSGRIGFVLGNGGGALSRLVPIFKAFAGGPLGSGRQMISWIHLDDTVGAFMKALDDQTLSGPMNVTAPSPVSNAEFSKVLGTVLGRPAILPAPKLALRTLFGEGAEPLLTGQNAIPRVLQQHGFRHRFTELKPALRDLLGR